ncbi:MAG: cytochrome c3 family protein [Phycisphaerae bacterium]
MNMRFHRGKRPLQGIVAITAVAAVLHVGIVGKPSSAQEEPKVPETAAAAKRGLKVKPLAAGRDKETLAKEIAKAQSAADFKPTMELLTSMDCRACHECEDPTHDAPCLRMCPRPVPEAITIPTDKQLPNDNILLNAFEWSERRFMPVPFDHKVHAEMGGVTGGCEVCHHYHADEGKPYTPCRACHKPVFAKATIEEMRMPSLKGAVHRQCMACHLEWSHSTKCFVCHALKGDQKEPVSVDAVSPPGDAASCPPIENPELIKYETKHDPGPYVTFRHMQHTTNYGYMCDRCHKGQMCSRCHGEAQEPEARTPEPVTDERHLSCFPCHEDDACERCHTQKERAEPKPFDHTLTGFSLHKYHGDLTCRDCHERLFFIRKLETECGFCHKDWDPDTFDHTLTGQSLDENHAEIDCEECHADGRYAPPPSCEECHDEDEGITFPARRPGPTATSPTPLQKH